MTSSRLNPTFVRGQRVTFTPLADAIEVLHPAERGYVGRNATVSAADGRPLIVTFDDCAAMVVYPDELTAVLDMRGLNVPEVAR